MMSDVRRFKRGSMHVRFTKEDIEQIRESVLLQDYYMIFILKHINIVRN